MQICENTTSCNEADKTLETYSYQGTEVIIITVFITAVIA